MATDFWKKSADAWNSIEDKLGPAMQNLGTVTSGLNSIVNAYQNNSKVDTSGYDEQNAAIQNQQFNIGDNSQLLSAIDNLNLNTDYIDRRDLRSSDRDRLVNSGKAILNGALAGGKTGNIVGAIVGAGLGAGSSLWGMVQGNKKASEEARRLNAERNLANAVALNNLDNASTDMQLNNYYDMMKNIAAEGGKLYHTHGGIFSLGNLRFINAGGTHEENPNQGVLQGFDENGTPNLVEEGEVVYNDYVFSNRLKASENALKKYGIKSSYKDKTYADIAKNITKESEERANDSISKRTMNDLLSKLTAMQEEQKQQEAQAQAVAQLQDAIMACGGKLKKHDKGGKLNLFDGITQQSQFLNNMTPEEYIRVYGALPEGYTPASNWTSEAVTRVSSATTPTPSVAPLSNEDQALWDSLDDANNKALQDNLKDKDIKVTIPETPKTADSSSLSTGLRYAPVLGSVLGALESLRPADYSQYDAVSSAINSAAPRTIRTRTVGNHMRYNPMDVNYTLNNIRNSATATRRGILNTGNAGAAQAALLAQDMNTGNQLGNALLQGRQYNDSLYNQVMQNNNAIDQYNSQAGTRADMFNAQAGTQFDQQRIQNLYNLANTRQQIDNTRDAATSSNLTNLFDNLGNVGRENFNMNQANSNLAYLYRILSDGTINFKG